MQLTKVFEKYIKKMLGTKVKIKPWKGSVKLPIFLRDLYEFHEIILFDELCIAAVERGGGVASPTAIKKHLNLLQEKFHGTYIYVCDTLSSYNRERLIECGIPFIIPGNQMYLPTLGIDL